MPDGIRAIANEAFCGCSNVTELKLPNNDVLILRDAFSGIYGITELIIPDKWTSIGYYYEEDERFYASDVFASCSSLRKVVIGKGVKYICDGAFSNCLNLREVVCPEDGSLEKIGEDVFQYTALTSMRFLPHTLKYMGSDIFKGCRMTEIYIPSSLEVYYGGSNHYADDELKTLVLEDSSEPIRCWPADGWFEEVYLGRAITKYMPFNVYNNSKNIKKVTFGPYFSGGNEWQFGNGVTEIYSQVTDPSLITCTFSTQVYDNATLYVPVGTKEAYAAQSNFKQFFDIREYTPDGISVATKQGIHPVSERYYDLNGRPINANHQKGIYIRKMSDGTTKKYLKK